MAENFDYRTDSYLLSQSKLMRSKFRDYTNLPDSEQITEEFIQANLPKFKYACITVGCSESMGKIYLLDRRN